MEIYSFSFINYMRVPWYLAASWSKYCHITLKTCNKTRLKAVSLYKNHRIHDRQSISENAIVFLDCILWGSIIRAKQHTMRLTFVVLSGYYIKFSSVFRLFNLSVCDKEMPVRISLQSLSTSTTWTLSAEPAMPNIGLWSNWDIWLSPYD